MLQGPRQRRGLQKPPGLPRLDTLAAPRGVYLYSVLDAMGTDLVTGRWGQRAYPLGAILIPTAFGQGTIASYYTNFGWSYAAFKDLPQTISSVFKCGTTDSVLVGCGLAGGLSVVSSKLRANWWNGGTVNLDGVTTLQTGFFYVATLVMTLHSMTLYLNGAFESTYSSVPGFANINITPIVIGSNVGNAQSLSICLANAEWSADEILSHARSPYKGLIWPEDDLLASLVGIGSVAYTASLTEAASAADILSSIAAFKNSKSDSASATDTLTSKAVQFISHSDAATATETITDIAAWRNMLTDAVTATDTPTSKAAFQSSWSDATSASDTWTNVAALLSSLSEAASGADQLTTLGHFHNGLTDPASATDALTTRAAYRNSVVDALTSGEAWSVTAHLAASIIDAANAADTLASVAHFANALSDTLHAQDVAETGFLEMLVDALAATELYTAQHHATVAIADPANAGDSFGPAVLALLAHLTDAVTGTDQLLTRMDELAAIIDSALATDRFIPFGRPFVGEVHLHGTMTTAVALGGAFTSSVSLLGTIPTDTDSD